ncbi:MAG: PHP domain-containing protein [Candidatus Sungbacteria bacterium]|uniref:PHP domain-containing protein n=1 Tax=Candidatus Sungiibacteriota bacterium TaxID=2750080 RepID=A0A932YWC3_9BACT|nr:PHP domain-containing protein [Candidatus Sungbacteria bacterium]
MRDIYPIDFQIQTTASDGRHTPAECVRMAKANGVFVLAITDHDTVAGIVEAAAAGNELGVRVIPGIEISIQEHGMHLLGLGIDPDDPALGAALERAAGNRLAAAREMVKKFQKDGWTVEWEDVLREGAGAAVVTRPLIVSAIMKRPENKARLEGIATKHDFFQKFFQDTGPYYVRASTFSPAEAIQLVQGAGGVAVWSHPPIPDFVGDCGGLEAFLKELITHNLDGIELFGPFLTEADMACLEALARRYRLIITAGSDFHEAYDPAGAGWPRSAAAIGEFPTFGRTLDADAMIAALDARIAERRARQSS